MTAEEITHLLEQMQATKSNALDRYLAHLTNNTEQYNEHANLNPCIHHRASIGSDGHFSS